MQLKDTNGNKYIADKMKNKSSHFFLKDEDNKEQRNQENNFTFVSIQSFF